MSQAQRSLVEDRFCAVTFVLRLGILYPVAGAVLEFEAYRPTARSAGHLDKEEGQRSLDGDEHLAGIGAIYRPYIPPAQIIRAATASASL